MGFLDIGEVAARSGLRPSALRYYEEIGLIASVARHGLRRQFSGEILLQLKLIALARAAGFTLDEIAGMFGKDGAPDLPRPLFRQKAEALDRRIEDLAALRDTLRHIADCPAPSHMECPTFRQLLAAAGTGDGTGRGKRPPTAPGGPAGLRNSGEAGRRRRSFGPDGD